MNFLRNNLLFVIVTIILCLLYNSLLGNHSEYFDKIDTRLSLGETVFLNRGSHEDDIKKILIQNNYVQTGLDAEFVSRILVNRLKEKKNLGSLFDLNKNEWKATIDEVESIGGTMHKDDYDRMCVDLEQKEISSYVNTFGQYSEITLNNEYDGEISVFVYCKDENASWLSKIFRMDKKPCKDVYVRLKEHTYNDTIKAVLEDYKAILKTDENGCVVFRGLNKDASYSVLPINIGYKYGNAKGTVRTTLKDYDDAHFEFLQLPITIPLFHSQTIRKIKDDGSLIVRTPDDFKQSLANKFLLILILWWGAVILLKLFRRPMDTMIAASLMGLTGISLLMMYSLNNPLTDVMIGEETATGIMVGCVLLFLIQFVNPITFYQDRLKVPFDFSSKVGFSKGVGYLLLGLLLTLLLFTPLGQEVGGMKVNLNLGIKFQPSEIAKYLMVIFMSAYFCQNAEKIILYSEPGRNNLLWHKYKSMLWMITGFGVLMMLYVLLQDLGPAMVVVFTFIIQYSIIKSKVDLKALNEGQEVMTIKNLLTCDIAMLIYGILTFLICLYIGRLYNFMLLAGILWFVVWWIWGYSKRKQVVESPMLFNLIIFAFVFGSSLKQIPYPTFEKIGERLEARSSMCTNTWGNLGLDGSKQEATENSQVVDGLWGLASGGWTGQGLTRGECSLIPAFNTDMILESIGTQLGFWGILFVMLLYCVLLRRTIVVGFKSYHPFTFYLCLGIAVATGVQLLIIALGSIGIIPLTGIAVPLLSYGKVSMILNLLAFGLVLSVSHNGYKSNQDYSEVNKYNGAVSILTCTFILLVLFVCGTFFKYQVFNRNETLVRPLLVKTDNGSPIIKYNPRIQLLAQNMRMGDIYDRNGVILATSEKRKLVHHLAHEKCNIPIDTIKKQSRYYPFDKHLFFMLGDYNTKLFFNGSDRGYMAEARHLDLLRGYSNIKKDIRGKEIKIDISPVDISAGKFVKDKIKSEGVFNVAYRDYSVLLPYLKEGLKSERVADYNNNDESWWNLGKIKPNDIHLTVDAVLQTRLQQGMEEHMKKNYLGQNWNKIRASVVILDANKGDLLASAVYPLPDYDILSDANVNEIYNDRNKPNSWKAYTDMDLGLSFPTPPGSTAKVVTGLAGLKKCGIVAGDYKFYYYPEEKVGADPNRLMNRWVNMDDAITWSSNNYVIKLLNTYDLYEDLGQIYTEIGVSKIGDEMRQEKDEALERFEMYLEKGQKAPLTLHRAWQWAWGQGTLNVTPLQMAKIASLVVNDGKLSRTRYLLDEEIYSTRILQANEAQLMKIYMKHEAKYHSKLGHDFIGGKTGTPERPIKTEKIRTKDGKDVVVVTDKSNDGWYICFIEKENINNKEKDSFAIAVRIERTGRAMSGRAVNLTKNIVIKTLQELNYI